MAGTLLGMALQSNQSLAAMQKAKAFEDSQCKNESGIQEYINQACKARDTGNSSKCPAAVVPAVTLPGFGDRFMWLFILVGIALLLLALSRIFHVRWTRTTKRRQESGDTDDKNQILLTRFVEHFVPSDTLASYQFKGMKKNTTGISLEFNELGLKLKNGRPVLAGVTGNFEEGKMVAVMGPSGCGKSTFLNVLCGKATYGTMTGEIKINGKQGNMHELMPIMGFVPQDDVVHEGLTVREQICYSAELRNAAGTGKLLTQAIVEDTLSVLQVGHIQRSIVGGVEERGISGGQRKRVNIGLELAACPALLFLDEPTSGLDSTSSLQIIDSLKKMTSLNMTIIMVIHQPRYSLFQLFDQVLLLGPGGLTCYLGPAQDAVAYFESLGFRLPANDNPADWLMDVLSGAAKNDAKPKFALADLVESWKTLGDKWRNGGGSWKNVVQLGEEYANDAANARTHRNDDRLLARSIHDHLAECWAKIDIDGNRTMDSAELKALLEVCMHEEIMDDGVAYIMDLIATSTGVSAERVGKDELNSFLCAEAKKLRELTSDQSLREQGSSMVEKMVDAGDKLEHAVDNLGDVVLSEKHLEHGDMKRKTPGRFQQFRIELHRTMVQWWRQIKRRCIDMAMITLCALVMAYLSIGDPASISNNMFMQLGIALLTCVSVLKTFRDRTIFWRESARGLNTYAFFCARTTADLFDMFIQVVVYVTIFVVIVQPMVAFEVFFVPCLLAAFAAGGWGYIVAAIVPPDSAAVFGVILMLILGGALAEPGMLMTGLGQDGVVPVLLGMSPTRWSTQMVLLSLYERLDTLRAPPMPDCPLEQAQQAQQKIAETFFEQVGQVKIHAQMRDAYQSTAAWKSMGNMGSGIFALVLQGVLLRFIGFLALKYGNRDKKV